MEKVHNTRELKRFLRDFFKTTGNLDSLRSLVYAEIILFALFACFSFQIRNFLSPYRFWLILCVFSFRGREMTRVPENRRGASFSVLLYSTTTKKINQNVPINKFWVSQSLLFSDFCCLPRDFSSRQLLRQPASWGGGGCTFSWLATAKKADILTAHQ